MTSYTPPSPGTREPKRLALCDIISTATAVMPPSDHLFWKHSEVCYQMVHPHVSKTTTQASPTAVFFFQQPLTVIPHFQWPLYQTHNVNNKQIFRRQNPRNICDHKDIC